MVCLLLDFIVGLDKEMPIDELVGERFLNQM